LKNHEPVAPKEEERLPNFYLSPRTKESCIKSTSASKLPMILSLKQRRIVIVGALAFALIPAISFAQVDAYQRTSASPVDATSLVFAPEAEALPDAPSSTLVSSSAVPVEGYSFGGQTRPTKLPRQASPFAKTIEPGEVARKLTIGDKILLGVRENATYTAVGGWLLSAAYEQAVNGAPNYGQTGKGFAQRLGAAAARNASENIFSDSVIAPIMHQDPRYYRLGPGHNFFKRVVYSGTRGIITRTDGGHTTFNFSNVGGDLGGSALTQWYYPPINRSFTQVMQTWGGSIGGDAVGYLFAEFLPNGLGIFHHGN
jgi:hypothetical protein